MSSSNPKTMEKLNLFQIPKLNSKFDKPPVFVSLVDASGSMHRYWPTVAETLNEFVPKERTITITFDDRVHYCRDNVLHRDQRKHGGGMTNIPQAFEVMEKELAKQYPDISIPAIVLFVSDGQDNSLRTLENRLKKLKGNMGRRITFLCLGIESAFPTFLSMWLREFYHNGENTVPALYLIEYWSEQAMRNKMESMKSFFIARKQVKVNAIGDKKVYSLPWEGVSDEDYSDADITSTEGKDAPSTCVVEVPHDELGKKSPKISIFGDGKSNSKSVIVFEGSWISTAADSIEISALNSTNSAEVKTIDLTKENDTNLTYFDGVCEVFRGFMQELQMLSLQNDKNLKSKAQKCLAHMEKIVGSYEQHFGGKDHTINLLEEIENRYSTKTKTMILHADFVERIFKNKLRRNQFRILSAYDYVGQFTDSNSSVKSLSEWEAAKQIGIGTVTGSYAQRGNKLDVDSFKSYLQDFVELLQKAVVANEDFAKTKKDSSEDSLNTDAVKFFDPDVCVKPSYSSVIDFLKKDTNVLEGLSQLDNPFDLVENFPMIGLALNVKRFQGYLENAWHLRVKHTHFNQLADSIALGLNDFSIIRKDSALCNCVLPLFSKALTSQLSSTQRAAYRALCKSDVFHLLMTYVVQRRVDVNNKDAYLSLLANTAVSLLGYLQKLEASLKEAEKMTDDSDVEVADVPVDEKTEVAKVKAESPVSDAEFESAEVKGDEFEVLSINDDVMVATTESPSTTEPKTAEAPTPKSSTPSRSISTPSTAERSKKEKRLTFLNAEQERVRGLIDDILESVNFVYGEDDAWKKYIKDLEEDPLNTLESHNETSDLSKPILGMLFLALYRDFGNKDSHNAGMKPIISHLVRIWLVRAVVSIRKPEFFLEMDDESEKAENPVKAHFREKFNQFKTLGELGRAILDHVDKEKEESNSSTGDSPASNVSLSVKVKNLANHMGSDKVDFGILSQLAKITTVTLTPGDLLFFIRVLVKANKEADRTKIVAAGHIEADDAIYDLASYATSVGKSKAQCKDKIVKDLLAIFRKAMRPNDLLVQELKNEFSEKFAKEHETIFPMHWKHFRKEYCSVNEKSTVSKSIVGWCEETKLAKRVCMAPECAFYMKEVPPHHFGTWRGKMPFGFHSLVAQKCTQSKKSARKTMDICKTVDTVLDKWCDQHTNMTGERVTDAEAELGWTKEKIGTYVTVLRDAYVKLQN